MAQPSTIYKPGKLNYVWNYIGTTLKDFKAKLLGYRVYTASLSQTGSADPVVTVHENSLGQEIVWTRQSMGTYVGTATGLFAVPNYSKVALLCSQTSNSSLGVTVAYRNSNDDVYVETFDFGGAVADGVLSESLIEIRMYL